MTCQFTTVLIWFWLELLVAVPSHPVRLRCATPITRQQVGGPVVGDIGSERILPGKERTWL